MTLIYLAIKIVIGQILFEKLILFNVFGSANEFSKNIYKIDSNILETKSFGKYQ